MIRLARIEEISSNETDPEVPAMNCGMCEGGERASSLTYERRMMVRVKACGKREVQRYARFGREPSVRLVCCGDV